VDNADLAAEIGYMHRGGGDPHVLTDSDQSASKPVAATLCSVEHRLEVFNALLMQVPSRRWGDWHSKLLYHANPLLNLDSAGFKGQMRWIYISL
jgi:hypothetical protein